MPPNVFICLLCGALLQGAQCFAERNHLERLARATSSVELSDRTILSVNDTLLKSSPQSVEVRWSGVESPSYDDWIALYVPAAADITKTAPVAYQLAARSSSHITSGAGNLRFNLLNLRQSMAFVFFQNGFDAPVAVARSQTIDVANVNQPTQAHLALTSIHGEMSVQWVTANSSHPTVKWGTTSSSYSSSVEAETVLLSAPLCGAPASQFGYLEQGASHRAVMTGLAPSTRYYYIYGDEEWGWSLESHFVTPPNLGCASTAHVLATADVGQGSVDGSMNTHSTLPGAVRTVARLLQEVDTHGLLLHYGDIAYADGYLAVWDMYMSMMEPVARRVPYMVTVGNHERDWPSTGDAFNFTMDSGGECGLIHDLKFKMPDAGQDMPWYSFNYGPIHFLVFSTEHPFMRGSPQHDWILQDLAAVDRLLTPWLVVGGHRPMYVSSFSDDKHSGDQLVGSWLKEALEDVFYIAKVDLALYGHKHMYQRSCPMFKGECLDYDNTTGEALAPVHMIIGNGGAHLSPTLDQPSPEYWKAIIVEFGYLRISADCHMLQAEMMSSESGLVMDQLRLVRAPIQGHDGAAASGIYTGVSGDAAGLVLPGEESLPSSAL